MSEGEQHTQGRRQVGDTPLLITEDELDAMRQRNVRGGTIIGRTRAYIMQKTAGVPILQEHLLIVLDGLTRASRSWICWAVLAVLAVLVLQNGLVQMSVEREHTRRPIAFKRLADDNSFDLEHDIGDAYREWKLLQEQFPNKFGNFSQFLLNTKHKESRLRRRISELDAQRIRLLNQIVVPPASKLPEYTKEEEYELTWSYLMREKSWPYVGSEKYLDQFRNDSRHYYNSLAVFPHNNRTRLHGLAGIYSNGTRSWTPLAMPPPIDESPAGRDAELKDGGFYLRLSNALPLDREVPDLREDVCKRQRFNLEELEDVSIVITFYNEHTSTLLRSVHSVLNNTPPPLLREIILVDDHSNTTDISPGGYLDDYLKLLPKTKVFRLPERRGLVQARLSGAKIAKAPIIVVLDSHIEVGQGWLEPLVKRLAESPKSVVFPQIMSLDPVTFDYRRDSGISCFLSFKWMMQERPYFDPPKHADPVASPSMAGGLFAVRRDWFYDLGGYDEEMKMWGAENVEMGFRYWMCGGRVECMPCSWTYHIYRHGGVGYKSPGKYIARNRARTAVSWLGPYWQIAREFMGKTDTSELGPFDKVKAIKKKHKCKSFDWFLKNVDPTRYGTDHEDYGLIGEIRNVGFHDRCLDSLQQKGSGKPLGSYGCHGEKGAQGWFEVKSDHQIRNMSTETICVGNDLTITHCESKGVDDLWVTLPQYKWIAAAKDHDILKRFVAPTADIEKDEAEEMFRKFSCLGFTDDKKNLTMAPCKTDNKLLQWEYTPFKWDPDYQGPEEMLS